MHDRDEDLEPLLVLADVIHEIGRFTLICGAVMAAIVVAGLVAGAI